MSKENLLKSMKNISFTHLYFDQPILKSLLNHADRFSEFESLDINKTFTTQHYSDIVFIELGVLNKQNFEKLKEIVKTNSSKTIYIFANESDNSFLLKFALMFSVAKVNPLQDDKKEIEKNLVESCRKHLLKLAEKHQLEISKKINSFFAFLIFKEESLIFANEKAKELFGTESLSDIEEISHGSEEIAMLLKYNEPTNQEIIIENEDGENWKYDFVLNPLGDSNDKLISILPIKKVVEEEAFLSTINRFKFIELLKDKFATQEKKKAKDMYILFINIANYNKLIKSNKKIEVHDFIKQFIEKLYFNKESTEPLVQWNPHFFMFLIDGEKREVVKNILEELHEVLVLNDLSEKISPTVTSSMLEVGTLSINEIIDSIEHISEHRFNAGEINSDSFYEIKHLNPYEEESDQINHYMQTYIGNESPIKLLNIYKGLCINTQSKVIKQSGDSYFIYCENLQGYSMKFDNKTVIQAVNLPKDIEANIVYVNLEKSYAVIDDLRFLEFSANNREHTRVQPNIRTPIRVQYQKNSYNGEIMDLSTQAIAIKLNHSLSKELVAKQVELSFKLPDNARDDGFSSMDIEGKVVAVQELDMTKTKLVIMMELDKPYDSFLMKYMYTRQKELIVELKRAIKVRKK